MKERQTHIRDVLPRKQVRLFDLDPLHRGWLGRRCAIPIGRRGRHGSLEAGPQRVTLPAKIDIGTQDDGDAKQNDPHLLLRRVRWGHWQSCPR